MANVSLIPESTPAFLKDVKHLLEDGNVFLEAGCGVGKQLFELASDPRVKHAVGLDFSRYMIKKAKQLQSGNGFSNVSFIIGDVRHLPFKQKTFDLILSIGVIEHFSHPKTLIDEMMQTLKTNGYLIVETPNEVSIGTTDSWVKKVEKNLGRQDLYTPKDLGFLIKKAGMNVVKTYSADFGFSVSLLLTNHIPNNIPNLLKRAICATTRLLFQPLNSLIETQGFMSVAVAQRR